MVKEFIVFGIEDLVGFRITCTDADCGGTFSDLDGISKVPHTCPLCGCNWQYRGSVADDLLKSSAGCTGRVKVRR